MAHTMSRIYRRATSIVLKQKLQRLMQMSTAGSNEYENLNSEGSQVSSQRMAAVIEPHLWCLMQRKLVDSAACRKLKPLIAPKRGVQIELQAGEMLEGAREIAAGNQLGVEPLSKSRDVCDSLSTTRTMSAGERRPYNDVLFDDEALLDVGSNDEEHLLDDMSLASYTAVGEDLFWEDLEADADILDRDEAGTQSMHRGEPVDALLRESWDDAECSNEKSALGWGISDNVNNSEDVILDGDVDHFWNTTERGMMDDTANVVSDDSESGMLEDGMSDVRDDPGGSSLRQRNGDRPFDGFRSLAGVPHGGEMLLAS